MQAENAKLLIVYNADGGILNALVHAVHKSVFPATYPCSLCAITYGAVSMRKVWRDYLDTLPMDKVFHHRDDFAADYPEHDFDLPAILIREGDAAPRLLLGPEELDAMTHVDQLIAALDFALQRHIRAVA